MVVGRRHVVEAGPPAGVAHPLEARPAFREWQHVAEVVQRPRQQHPVLDALGLGDGHVQRCDALGTAVRDAVRAVARSTIAWARTAVAPTRSASPIARSAHSMLSACLLLSMSIWAIAAIVAARSSPAGSASTSCSISSTSCHMRSSSLRSWATRAASRTAPRRARLAELAGGQREEPLGVAPRLVVGADQPGGACRPGEQIEVVGSLGEGGDGDAQRLVGRPDVEIVADADAGQLDHLVVVAGTGGVAGEVGEVGAHRLAQHVEGLLVESSPLAPEQLVLDGVADELVAEAELVVGLLDEQPALDEGAQDRRSAPPRSGRRGRPARRTGPWPEHRGRLDDPPLVGGQPVELAADQLGERPRQRLAGERLGLDVAGGGEDLLEEERVAAGAIAQGVDDCGAERPAVDGGDEGADLVRSRRSRCTWWTWRRRSRRTTISPPGSRVVSSSGR